MRSKQSPFVLSLVASALLVGCNGAESDAKLAKQSEEVTSVNQISGVALDGYLKAAKVCLDLNQNLSCDSSDGDYALTDSQGRYTLPVAGQEPGNVSIIVEAIPYQTIDMDSPDTPIQNSFVLSAPAGSPSVVTPLTTIIAVVAKQQGLDYQSAQALLAKHLNVDSHRLTADFLASKHVQDMQLHAFAQGLTVLMQEGEKQSVVNGVTRLDARKGTQAKVALLDLAALKAITDKLVGTVDHTPEKIRAVVKGLSEEVAVIRDDIDGSQITVAPPAPANGQVNDAADIFDWDWVGLFTASNDYEYSTDGGKSWRPVTVKPLLVGPNAHPIGDIQVRVRADLANNIKAGKVLKNLQPFTESSVPAAPASVTVNDAENYFDWELVPSYSHASDYEYSTDGGIQWQLANNKPQEVEDIAIAAGALQVRVAADDSGFEPQLAGKIAVSQSAFITTPNQPAEPMLTAVSDETDSVDWDFAEGFTQFNQYEVSFDNGKSWSQVEKKPLSVGNRELPVGAVHIRVAGNKTNGMPAGLSAIVQQAFTVQAAKPIAPGNLRVNDDDNTIDWDWADGFAGRDFYEISLHGISAEVAQWHDVGGKPAAVPDENFDKGEVCIRVKAGVIETNVSGVPACSDAYFTTKPSQPTAPVIDDENDTFGWTLVDGYPLLSSYQIKIGSADWIQVPQGGNPYQLEDKEYKVGSIQVRVGPDMVTGRVAGDVLENDIVFTKKTAPVSSDVTLLTADGFTTQNRAEAACARMPDGKVWQLFNTSDATLRFKTGSDIYAERDTFSACGIDSWRMPTTTELQSLFTENPIDAELKVFDSSVFAYLEVVDSIDKGKKCYLSSDDSTATPGEKECLDISKIDKPVVRHVADICEGFCAVFGNAAKPLYRFIAE